MPQLFARIDTLPTIGVIVQEKGKGAARAVITKNIAKMLIGLPHEMTVAAVERLIDYILANYKNLKPEEFNIIGQRFLKKKIYSKLYINDIATEIDSYWDERCEYAASEQQKKKSQHSNEINLDIKKAYSRMKTEAEEKANAPTPKERALKAAEENARKIEKLKEEYGDDFSPK